MTNSISLLSKANYGGTSLRRKALCTIGSRYSCQKKALSTSRSVAVGQLTGSQHRPEISAFRGALTQFSTCSSSSPASNGNAISSSTGGATGSAHSINAAKPADRFSMGLPAAVALTCSSLLGGYFMGTSHSEQHQQLQNGRALPNGQLRGCCSCDSSSKGEDGGDSSKIAELSPEQASLSSALSSIVGKDYVHDGMVESSATSSFLTGARLGKGKALCIVQPGTLKEAVRCLQAIVDAGCVVVPQGRNTGLTGGSVPRNNASDTRPPVILSLSRLNTHFPIDNGHRVVCLAGTGISTLASSIQTWFPDRESHSILGSVFLNPTTAAGIAFGSGGVYLRKGPARTDRALYCKVSRNKWGENVVSVVNTLGIDGLEDDDFSENCGEDAVGTLDAYVSDVRQGFRRAMASSTSSKHGKAKASDSEYRNKVCECTKDVSRYNADTSGEDCNRSEGKVLILATVHDTFPQPEKKRTFWVSFPDLETALAFRRKVCLDNPKDLPILCEYMDRDSVDIIDRSGRIMTHVIRLLGPGSMTGYLWGIKLKIESLPFSWAPLICDKLMHNLNNWFPAAMPRKFIDAGRQWDHHVFVMAGDFGDGSLDRFMERMNTFVKEYNDNAASKAQTVNVEEATSSGEVDSLNAFRFCAAAAFKTWCVGENAQGISVDYALPKNGGLPPPLPEEEAAVPLKRMRYSHFGCNVVHEDLAYELGVDTHKEKMTLKHSVEDEGGKLPAEHGHGTEYVAPKDAKERWKKMDPLNVMNPGVGGLSYKPKYAD